MRVTLNEEPLYERIGGAGLQETRVVPLASELNGFYRPVSSLFCPVEAHRKVPHSLLWFVAQYSVGKHVRT